MPLVRSQNKSPGKFQGVTAPERPHSGWARTTRELAAPRRAHLACLAIMFIAFAVYGSWVPLDYAPLELAVAIDRFQNIPFLDLGITSRADWVANLLLFMPIGFFVLGALSVDHPRGNSAVAIVVVFMFCAGLSVMIEFTQLWFPRRTVSQNDILAETLGGLIGAVAWHFIGQVLTVWWLLQAYLLGLVFYSVLPMDLTISVAEIYRKYEEGRIVVVPFSYRYDSVFSGAYQLFKDVAVFIPVGALACMAFVSAERRMRSVLHTILIGTSLVVGLEIVQLFVYSRFADFTDVVTGSAGVTAGAILCRRWLGAPALVLPADKPHRQNSNWLLWFGAALAYATLLSIRYWIPFEFTTDTELIKPRLANFFSVPFSAMYVGSEFKAAGNLLQKILFFAPLGALFAATAYRLTVPPEVRRIFLGVFFLLCGGVALGIELIQVLSPRHTPDITDVMIYSAGALMGMILTSRLHSNRDH